jgi:hypothetical protein
MVSYGQSTVLVPFSGSNSVASCTNVILQDHAGSSNYSDNANGYTVLNASGSSTINISGSYQTESGYDNIWIYAGSGTSGSVLATYTGTGNVNYTGAAGQTLTVRFGSDVSAQGTGFNFNVTYSGCSPTISVTQSLYAFSQCGSTPSVSQTFSVSGVNLTNSLQVGPLTDFQFSLDNTTFSNSLTLTPTSGSIANTTIYIRLNRSTNGTSSGNVPLATTGATTQNIAVSGERLNSVTPSISGLTNVTAGESITLTGSGTPNVNSPWTSSNTNIATVNNSGVVSGTGAGTVSIIYMNSSGCTAASSITVAAAPIPTITSFSPTSAEVGATVIITGTNFSTTASNNIVFFGGARATVTNATATQLTVTVPNGSTRDFISVTKGGLTAYSKSNFNLFNSGTATISGAYSFGSAVTISAVATTSSGLQNSYPGFDVIVGAADFDNDGWPDIYKAGNGSISVNRNLLTGTVATIASNHFSAPSSFTVTGDVRSIVTADVDSDGKLDIITGSSTGISILRNTSTSGTISFATAVNITTATTNIKVADFNLNGKLDIAAVNDGNLNIFNNTSTTSISFSNAVATALSSTGFTGIDIGDLNNDGKIDIIATKNGASTDVIVNNSSVNSLSLSNSFTISNGTYYPIVDDIDKDGIVDIYTWNKFFKNNYSTGALSSSNFSEFTNSLVNEGGLGISAPDFNADGYPDIILGSWWSHFWLYRNAGTGVSASIFSSRQTCGTGGNATGVDLNGDQKVDLIASNHGNNGANANFTIYQNTMTPTSVITVNNSMTTFNKCNSVVSSEQSFTVSGAGLQANIVITPPAGFEISTTTGTGFGTTAITLTQTGGTVNSTTIYVRVPSANNTSTSGTLSLTSTGASTVNVSLASTVNPNATIGAASYSPNVCPNVAMTSVTHATTGATGIGSATGLPTGLTAAWASNTITISGTPTQSGTFNYSIPLTGCGSVNATGTIIVKGTNLSVTSQPSTTNQVYCVNATATTLSITATDVNTYQWYAMDGANWSGQAAISGATSASYTPPTNVIGTKYYRCAIVSCSGSNTSSQVSGAITTTDGSVWTGTVSTDPTNAGNWNTTCGSGNKIIIAGTTYSPVFTDLTIAQGESFTLQEGAKVTVNGILSNSGTLTIKNNATLLQGATSTYVGSGSETVNVNQKITGGSSASAPNGRFWYLGSPVTNANATTFYSTASSNVVKERDEPTNAWVTVANNSSTALTPGKGYYVRASNGSASSLTQTELALNFTGGGLNNNPTSGALTIPCTRTTGVNSEGFNLVSNPYPSYLNWDLVTKNNVGNTMWYRTSTGSFSSSTMVFETYVAGAAGGIGTNLSGNVATKLIPPLQAFWVRVNQGQTTGSIALDNSMRSHFSSISGSTAGLRSTNDELKVFLRMNLLQEDKKDQLIVYMNGAATNGFDILDGEKMMQAGTPQFYTKAGDKKIVINGLNSAKKQHSLPITMELPTTGVHTFEIENLELETGLVWLEDAQEGTMETITEGYSYQFYGEAGINADRFVLHFNILDNSTPSAPNYGEVNSSANFSGKGASVHAEAAGVVVIKLPASTEGVTDIQIRDAAGRVVYTGSTNTLETSVKLEQANGIYYVTLNATSGVEVRKVFIQQ